MGILSKLFPNLSSKSENTVEPAELAILLAAEVSKTASSIWLEFYQIAKRDFGSAFQVEDEKSAPVFLMIAILALELEAIRNSEAEQCSEAMFSAIERHMNTVGGAMGVAILAEFHEALRVGMLEANPAYRQSRGLPAALLKRLLGKKLMGFLSVDADGQVLVRTILATYTELALADGVGHWKLIRAKYSIAA